LPPIEKNSHFPLGSDFGVSSDFGKLSWVIGRLPDPECKNLAERFFAM